MKAGSLLLATMWLSLALAAHSEQGSWKLLKKSIGISAMHMALLPNDRVVTFDRTDFGPSNLTFSVAKCSSHPQASDCFAHSVEFNPADRGIRPLTIRTDTWCSSGALSADGVLIQSGGFAEGERVVRSLKPCQGCDWIEDKNALLVPRWYASNQVLPNGKIIVVGGRYQFSYEFIPKRSSSDQTLYHLPFLQETRYLPEIPNNLYPFLHLSPDGNLFIFANTKSILFDYVNNKVIRKYPEMPGGVSRSYPSTGSSVLLPLHLSKNSNSADAQVFICGGTLPDSFEKSIAGVFLPASKTCGRMAINAEHPKWEMEEMPVNRVMGDMILLPTGDVLIINGASKGTAGWELATDPVLNPVLYRPDDRTPRFQKLAPTKIPRLYHSSAHLLSDGRVLVGGSNPHSNYNFTARFPTELSLEAFYPPYLSSKASRPLLSGLNPAAELTYKQKLSVRFKLKQGTKIGKLAVTMVAPSFTSHSYSMNQRLLFLAAEPAVKIPSGDFVVQAYAPPTAAVAPPGYYQLFVVHEGVPSQGSWVRIK